MQAVFYTVVSEGFAARFFRRGDVHAAAAKTPASSHKVNVARNIREAMRGGGGGSRNVIQEHAKALLRTHLVWVDSIVGYHIYRLSWETVW